MEKSCQKIFSLALPALIAWLLGTSCRDVDRIQASEGIAMLDESELDFGAVPVGEWREALVHINNVGAIPIDVTEVLPIGNNPNFFLEVPQTKIFGGNRQAVRVRFHPLTEGVLEHAFTVTTNAEDGPKKQVVPVRGLGTPTRIEIFPRLVDYENVETDSDRTLQVQVKNPVDIPLTFQVTGAGRKLNAEGTVLPSKSALVGVHPSHERTSRAARRWPNAAATKRAGNVTV